MYRNNRGRRRQDYEEYVIIAVSSRRLDDKSQHLASDA